MSHTAAAPKTSGNTMLILAVCVGLVAAGFWYSGTTRTAEPVGRNGYEIGSSIPKEVRVATFKDSVKKSEAISSTWPSSDEALVRTFWGELIKGDFEKAIVYAPGTTTKDLAPYAGLKPASIVSVGAPTPHATEKGIVMVPLVVDFQQVKGKALRMAVTKLPDGRAIIHGGFSEWW